MSSDCIDGSKLLFITFVLYFFNIIFVK